MYSDYKDDGTNCLLDANENAYGPGIALDGSGRLVNGLAGGDDIPGGATELDLQGLNRYPDPHQEELKQLLCDLRHDPSHYTPGVPRLTPDNLFVGVGSDEAIDNLMRCFCTPGKDKILVCPPSYGMYNVAASINDIAIVKVPLIASDNFALDLPSLRKTLDEDAAAHKKDPSRGRIKLIFLCSPGNPTGKLISKSEVEAVLNHASFNGVVVVDEAYVDFSPPSSSLAAATTSWPNLCVMQTLSKAFGLAGIRLGAAFTDPAIARLMNSLKAPYNISSLTSQLACQALQTENLKIMREHEGMIGVQRDRMIKLLPSVPGVGKLKGGFDANFLLVEILDAPEGKPDNPTALRVYEDLASKLGVVCRFRGKEHGCEGCLRVTVGTEDEVTRLLAALRQTLSMIHADDGGGRGGVKVANGAKELKKQKAASAVVG